MTWSILRRYEPSEPSGAAYAGVKHLSLWLALGLLLVSLSWVVPGRFLPWPAFRQEVIAGVGFVLLAGAALEQSKHLVWPRLAFAAFAVATVPLIQCALDQIQFRGDAIVCALYLAGFALSLAVGASLAHGALRGQLLEGLMLCLIVVGVVSTGMAFNQWLGPSVLDGIVEGIAPRSRPYANMGQPNHLATQLILGIVAVVYCYEQRRIGNAPAALAVVWMGWGVVLTQSRMAWLALATLFIWWLLMRRRAALRTTPIAMAIGASAFVIGVWLLPALLSFWSGPADFEGGQVRLATGTRLGHWQTLWAALMRSPWFGYGWNQVANAQFEVAVDFPFIGEWTTQSHNLVLDLLIYNGLPLGLLICAALVAWFVSQIAACRNAQSWCLLMMLFALFVHALLEYPLHFSYYLLLTGLLMGFAGESSPALPPARRAPRITLAIPTLALALLAGAIGLEYLKAEEALRDLELTARRIGPAASELPRADWFFVDGWAAYHRAVTVGVEAGMPANEIENLRRVARRYPYPNVLERYALASALNGQFDVAKHVLLHSCKVHTLPICEGLQRRWKTSQSEHPALRGLAFPALTK
jgi:O-antigen ligase